MNTFESYTYYYTDDSKRSAMKHEKVVKNVNTTRYDEETRTKIKTI